MIFRTPAGYWFVIEEPDRMEWLNLWIHMAAFLIVVLTIFAAMKAYGF